MNYWDRVFYTISIVFVAAFMFWYITTKAGKEYYYECGLVGSGIKLHVMAKAELLTMEVRMEDRTK